MPVTHLPRAGEELLRTAAELFACKGINAVGITEVVATAHTARDSLYRLFGARMPSWRRPLTTTLGDRRSCKRSGMPARRSTTGLGPEVRALLQGLPATAGAADPGGLTDALHGQLYGMLSKAMVAAQTARRVAGRQATALLTSAGIPLHG